MFAEVVLPGGLGVGSLLAAGGIAVVAYERFRGRSLRSSVLAARWTTWAVIAVVWLAAAAWQPALISLIIVTSTVGLFEYLRLRPATTVDLLAGVVLVTVPMLILFQIHHAYGPGVFLALGLSIALSDIGAFVVGSAWGGRRLAPVLSPNKTWAGVGGNLAGALLGLLMMAALGVVPWWALWLTPVVGLGALTGDLLISLVKRKAGVKDAGSWLPGFGGLLDRVDSTLVAAPAVFVALTVGSLL